MSLSNRRKDKNAPISDIFKQILKESVLVQNPLPLQESDETYIEISYEELIAIRMLERALAGDVAAANLVLDRAYGKVKPSADIDPNSSHNLRYLSEEEIKAELLKVMSDDASLLTSPMVVKE